MIVHNTPAAGETASIEDSMSDATRVDGDVMRVGGDVIKRVIDEIEHHPLTVIALVAGIGYFVGLSRR
ncbi:MAG: hypothetical protein ACR2K5_10320 [Pseudolabrys sp.]